VIQVSEYYAYGLQSSSSWTREGNDNNFLYNGGTEQNSTTGLYDLAYRNFDPVLGRFHQVDPWADKYSSLSPYNFANNNPVTYNDPAGLEAGSQGGCNWCMFSPKVVDSNYSGGGSGGGGGWNTATGQSIVNFIAQSLYQGPTNGGSWNNGSVTMFGSDFDALMAGYEYNDLHDSWAYTTLFGGVAINGNLSGAMLGDYKGVSGTFKNVGFTDGSIGIHEKFIPFTSRGLVPGITVLNFGPLPYDPDNLGVYIRLGYNDPEKRYPEYKWIQTIRTNAITQAFAKSSPFNDAPGDNTPFFWTDQQNGQWTNVDGFSAMYMDNAGRPKNSINVDWTAEFTIGGVVDGVFHPIGTMTYRFTISYGIQTIYPLMMTQPSNWHIDSFTNKSKW
jgi:RHS repeat-associated protein